MSNRIPWLDYTKGFGILMIMLAHVSQYIPVLAGVNRYACSFHVPIFFIVAGYLCEKRRSGFSKKRIVNLLVPYLFFSLINFCLKIGVCFITKSLTQELLKSELIELFITGNGTVWFLPCLCLVEIVGGIICNSNVKDYVILIVSSVLFILSFCILTSHSPFAIFLIRIVAGSGYYCVGYFFARQRICEKPIAMVIGILLIGGIFTERFCRQTIDFFGGRFAFIVPSLICSICSSLGYMLLFAKLQSCLGKVTVGLKNILEYYGYNSLIVMLVHPIILQMIMFPFGKYISGLQGILSGVIGIVIFIILAVAEIPCIKIINTYCPILVGKRKEK